MKRKINFKFLTSNNDDIDRQLVIAHAVTVGREYFLNGMAMEDNPFDEDVLKTAFEQGWELEWDYEILRQAQQRANNEI